MANRPILQVQNLYKYYSMGPRSWNVLVRKPQTSLRAVDGVSFEMQQGEILALAGESGSGKTTVGMNVLGLQLPTKGSILFDGYEVSEWARGYGPTLESDSGVLSGLSRRKRVLALRRRAQMIFQNPYEVLNPRQKVLDIVAEPLGVHKLAHSRGEEMERIQRVLEECGLTPSQRFMSRFPDELSGGQRQRVAIACAIVANPDLLVADEPVSMLDIPIRSDILNLLHTLCEERKITIMYITHDLITAGSFADRIAVMYLGRIVEIGPTIDVLSQPCHPYTRALVSVVPTLSSGHYRQRVVLKGEIPNPANLPPGCRFHPRCPNAVPLCQDVEPELRLVAPNHKTACVFA
jgi:peptide/nickel transport system ATP-binding protein